MIAKLKRRLLHLWSVAPVATVLLVLALAATLMFGMRSVMLWTDRHDRIQHEQPVAAWMTPGYVAHSWNLPRQVVIDALSLDPKDGPPRETLSDLAKKRGVPVENLISALETAIAEHRAAHPDPNGTAPLPDNPQDAAPATGENAGEGSPE